MMLASGIANGCFSAASKKAALRFSTSMSLLRVGAPTQRLYMSALKKNYMGQRLAISQVSGMRAFSDSAVVSQEEERGGELDMASENARLGVDTEFSQ